MAVNTVDIRVLCCVLASHAHTARQLRAGPRTDRDAACTCLTATVRRAALTDQYSAIAVRSSWRLLTCTRLWWEERALVQIWSASTHRLTTNRASISISVARSGRGTERLRVRSRSWRVRGRLVSVFRSFERCGAVQQQFGGSQAKDSCNNRRITAGAISYCMVHCELAGRNILSDRNSTRIWSEMSKLYNLIQRVHDPRLDYRHRGCVRAAATTHAR